MLSLADVNEMTDNSFVEHFGDIAEHSPWVARKAADMRPFPNRTAMVTAFQSILGSADVERQLDLINAHPDLAGKAMVAGDLTDDSSAEQKGAGLDQLTKKEFERFSELNNAYKGRFGFPFIFAVKGSDKYMILKAFETRLVNAPKTEFTEAIKQIGNILKFRIEERVADG